MAHDVFISYDLEDKPIADGICANLEAVGIRCWIAPRDISPHEARSSAISSAIPKCRIMVLVFSASSNASEDIGREIILAANNKLIIIPFKIENVVPEPGKQYYLARTHWLEAMNPPTREQIQSLVKIVTSIIPVPEKSWIVPPPPPAPKKEAEQDELPASTGKQKSIWTWLWIPILLVMLAILGLVMWPKFQAAVSPPTATPTVTSTGTVVFTIQPTFTLTPTIAFTQTATLKPTATLTTGTVSGKVTWGDQPYEGVTVTLCSNWTGTCKGDQYSSETDAQGEYVIQNIEPGIYEAITFVPEQQNLVDPGEYRPKVQVNAGDMIQLENIQKCKYDLQVTTSVKNGYVTLHAASYPEMNSYSFVVVNSYWSEGSSGYHLSTTTYTTWKQFSTGNYIWMVTATKLPSGPCASSIGWITVP